ncbi:MAG: hypothetical protein K2Q13_00195 [Nitrosomonas sp.]|uniref:hypothetical protein n=1 Tax=Nitrosomonas sp. TaxID=42353 RepID=UPI0025D2474F|nr:hypothetical protein [Nitrosomonas sp.]MBY0473464.1 hypothetical protein [Nitrosomonas sp.]
MPNTDHEKFSSQAAPEVLTPLRKIAESEGRPIQEIILDEALREYIERKGKGLPRRQAMDAFTQSLNEFDQLYHELAK